MTEIQKADPALRKRAIIILVAAMTLGAVPVFLLIENQVSVERWLFYNADYFVIHPEYMSFIIFILVLPLILGSYYFWELAERIIKDQRYPPEGQKVIKDTVIYTGRGAVVRAYLLKFLCALLFTACITAPVVFLYMLNQLSFMFRM